MSFIQSWLIQFLIGLFNFIGVAVIVLSDMYPESDKPVIITIVMIQMI